MANLRLVENGAPQVDPTVPRGILGAEKDVCAWVERQLELPGGHFAGCMAIGIVYKNQPIAGVVYSQYTKHRETGLVTIEAHIAATSPRFCTRPILRAIFAYPFVHLHAQRIQLVIRRKNKKSRDFAVRLGFKLCGIGRRAWDGRQDVAVYDMLPHECKWLGDANG
jgi:RimJ/RimL family protein N-acetyltransferase